MAETAALGVLKCAGSAIPQCIPQELKDKLTRPVSYLFFYGSNIAEIPTKIVQLKKVKVEVEARSRVAETNGEQIRHKIQEWLSATNVIIEKIESMETLDSNNCFCGSYEIGKLLDEIKKMMNEYESQHFGWVSYPADPPQISYGYRGRAVRAVRAHNKNLLSREKVVVEIFNVLKDSKVNMISINGIPGVGKTTLFEELLKRVEAGDFFQVIAKVNVSQDVDIKKIQESIAARIQLNLPEQGDEETRANLLYRQLETRLTNKKSKILVIFDDIFAEDGVNLDRIGIPFLPEGEPSCTLLISSRNSDMHKKMGGKCNFPLDCLDLVEAKILFRDRLGSKISNEEYMSEKYISMENDLLDKCGGLPTAITALAEALKIRWPDWDDVVSQLRNHKLSEVDGVEKTLHQSIKLSYDLLESDRKKNFFLLCSLFHPGEYLLLLGDGTQWMTRENYKKYTIVSMSAKSLANHKHWRHSKYDFKQLDSLELPKLEALFLKGEYSNLSNGYFRGMEKLTVLSMSKMKLLTLPTSIKYLKNLITLCVEYCEIEDATLLSILASLKVLSLRGSRIKAFPTNIGQLGDLRLLDLTSCCFGTILDDVVAGLSHLEGLYMCGSFMIEDTVGIITETLVFGLESFVHLNVLEIEIPSACLESVGDLLLGCSPVRFKIAIGCKVASTYREFSLYKRVLLLKGIDARLFSKQGLRDLLKRADCLSLVGITSLKKGVFDMDEDGLADLNCLHISHCNQMECICIVNTMGMPFEFQILPQLEILSLEHLLSLKVICDGAITQNWCVGTIVNPTSEVG